MPEVVIEIAGRSFNVGCQPGEEEFLHAAASLLAAEAEALSNQSERLSESRLLLMAGLMLADKTAGLEEELRAANERLSAQARLIDEMRASPRPVAAPQAASSQMREMLARIAARAEALAKEVEGEAQAMTPGTVNATTPPEG